MVSCSSAQSVLITRASHSQPVSEFGISGFCGERFGACNFRMREVVLRPGNVGLGWCFCTVNSSLEREVQGLGFRAHFQHSLLELLYGTRRSFY